jgi:hypothetical protein
VLPCFRTPGRHLRFRPEHVAAFLRAWGYAVPAMLRDAEPKHVAVIGTQKLERLVRQALEDGGIGVRLLEHPIDALLTAALEPPHAYVIDADIIGRDLLVAYTRALHRAAGNASLILVGVDDDALEGVVAAPRDAAALQAAFVRVGAGSSSQAPSQAHVDLRPGAAQRVRRTRTT